jgi:hypothetical protein
MLAATASDSIKTLWYNERKRGHIMKQITHATPQQNNDGPSVSPEVVSKRFGRAFPELTKWFRWLNGGYAAGATWQGLLAAHVSHIGELRTRQLLGEVQDVQHLGLPDGRSLEVLICDVLGLSKDFVIMEAKTAGRLSA